MEKILKLTAKYPGQVLYIAANGEAALKRTENAIGVFVPFNAQNTRASKEYDFTDIQVGWYHFTDGSFGPEPVEGKTPDQVVAYVDWTAPKGQQVRCFDIEEKRLPWATKNNATGALSFTNGQKNCAMIAAAAKELGFSTPALDYCLERGGYLEARDPLAAMLRNYETVNESFKKIGAKLIDPEMYYISSSEYYDNYNYAWNVRPSDGFMSSGYGKSYPFRVRCVYSY